MSDNTIELIRGVNPFPSQVPAPPFELMLERLEADHAATAPTDDLHERDRGSQQSAGAPERRRLSRVWRTAGAVAAIAVVIGVAAVVVDLAGHGPRNLDSTIKISRLQTWGQRLQASRRTLIAELAALRRPQTAAERAIARTLNRHERAFELFPGSPDRGLVRYAATTPWGERLYLVPITPWTVQQARAHEGKHVHAPPPVEEFTVYSPGADFNLGAGNAARIRAGTVGVSFWGPGGPRSGVTREVQVVPDGVAKVTYVLPRQPQAQFGYPVYPRVGHLTVVEHSNIVAFQTHRAVGTASTWYGTDGHVLRRFGNAAAAAKVLPVKRPAPETARSRAAERDPSTPNPVSVTEVGGGRTASFKLHFQALLNGADYGFEWSGPRCPGITLPQGFTQDVILRGYTVSTTLPLAPNQPGCAGTYHVSVRVIGLESIGAIRPVGRKITARPFGSATFTVH
jgi:hypothetical protein